MQIIKMSLPAYFRQASTACLSVQSFDITLYFLHNSNTCVHGVRAPRLFAELQNKNNSYVSFSYLINNSTTLHQCIKT